MPRKSGTGRGYRSGNGLGLSIGDTGQTNKAKSGVSLGLHAGILSCGEQRRPFSISLQASGIDSGSMPRHCSVPCGLNQPHICGGEQKS